MAASVADLCLQEKVSVDELTERSGLDAARVLAIVMGRWTPSPQDKTRIESDSSISFFLVLSLDLNSAF